MKRDLNGIVLLDKPIGITSNRALSIVKRLYKVKKAGHTGSLDPLATGMLPICFGQATKYGQFLLEADKCYQVVGRLGIQTTTADAEGEVVKECTDFSVSKQRLLSVLAKFTGEISQVPSMYSALKKDGKPLYEYAREGKTVERKARNVTIHKLELTNFDGRDFAVDVISSKGTYMRNLIEDIGEALDGISAHVIKLHRVYSSPFNDMKMISLAELESLSEQGIEKLDSHIHTMDIAVQSFPSLTLPITDIIKLQQGQQIQNSIPSTSAQQIHRLYDPNQNFYGLVAFTNNTITPHKMLPP